MRFLIEFGPSIVAIVLGIAAVVQWIVAPSLARVLMLLILGALVAFASLLRRARAARRVVQTSSATRR